MLIYSMSVAADGFIADREGAFGWTAPSYFPGNSRAFWRPVPSGLSSRIPCKWAGFE